MVIREMRLSRVQEQIEQHGIHSFTYGIMESERGYTRKRLDYRYHDRENKIILLSRTDITDIYFDEKKKKLEMEQALIRAQTDSLTKLLNFQATSDKITKYLADESQTFALDFIDLDDFKSINDNYGHPTGDSVLKNIASALLTIQGKDDIIGRVGGDEFVYFAPVSDKKHAAGIAQRICYAIHSVKVSHDTSRRVTGSVGIALAPKDGRDYDTLVHKADHGLYEAKKVAKINISSDTSCGNFSQQATHLAFFLSTYTPQRGQIPQSIKAGEAYASVWVSLIEKAGHTHFFHNYFLVLFFSLSISIIQLKTINFPN